MGAHSSILERYQGFDKQSAIWGEGDILPRFFNVMNLYIFYASAGEEKEEVRDARLYAQLSILYRYGVIVCTAITDICCSGSLVNAHYRR